METKKFNIGIHFGEASVGIQASGGKALLKALVKTTKTVLKGTGKTMKAVGSKLDK